MGKNTPEAIQHLRRAATAGPKLPWTHLALAEIYARSNFRDDTRLTAAIGAFRKLHQGICRRRTMGRPPAAAARAQSQD